MNLLGPLEVLVPKRMLCILRSTGCRQKASQLSYEALPLASRDPLTPHCKQRLVWTCTLGLQQGSSFSASEWVRAGSWSETGPKSLFDDCSDQPKGNQCIPLGGCCGKRWWFHLGSSNMGHHQRAQIRPWSPSGSEVRVTGPPSSILSKTVTR